MNVTVSQHISFAMQCFTDQPPGNYVRYAPNSLLFNTAGGLRDIYGNSSRLVKSTGYTPMVHRAPNTLTIRGGKEHSRRRRIMALGVSEKAQRGYEPRIMEHINKLCDVFLSEGPDVQDGHDGRAWSPPLNMAEWCNYLGFDIMADVVFGAKYDLVGNPRFRYVCDAIDRSNIRMGALIQAPRWAALKLDKYLFRDAIAARNRFVKFVVRVVAERMGKTAACAASPDLFANLAAAKDPQTNEGFRADEIGAESTTLIVAGSDTTSTSVASALFYLAHSPAAYARAAAEVRAAFAYRAAIAAGPALASCAYLRACVDEAMRMSPAVGSALWREVIQPGGAAIDGRVVPAGCDVGVGIYSVHHSREYFADPFVYRPERWIEGDDESVARGRSVFNPFSMGIRGCLGKGLAMTELMLSLATVLYVCDFKLAGGKLGAVGRGSGDGEYGRHRESEYQLFDHVTSQKEGPWLQFAPRAM